MQEVRDWQVTGELPDWFRVLDQQQLKEQQETATLMAGIRARQAATTSRQEALEHYKPWVLKELAELSVELDRVSDRSKMYLDLSHRIRELRAATLPHLDPIHQDSAYFGEWRTARKAVATKLARDLDRPDITPAEKVLLIDGIFHLRQVHVVPSVGGLVNDRRAYLFVARALRDLEWPVLSAMLRLDGGIERLTFRLVDRHLLQQVVGEPKLTDPQFFKLATEMGVALSEHLIRYMEHVRLGKLELGDPVLRAVREVVGRAKETKGLAEKLEHQGMDLQQIADNVSAAFVQCQEEVCSSLPLHSASRDIMDTLIAVYAPVGPRTFRVGAGLESFVKKVHAHKILQDSRGTDVELNRRILRVQGILSR